MFTPILATGLLLLGAAPYPYDGWDCTFNSAVECDAGGTCRAVATNFTVALDIGFPLYNRCDPRNRCESLSPRYETRGDLFVVSDRRGSTVLVVMDEMRATETHVDGNRTTVSYGRCERMQNSPVVSYNHPN